MLRGVSVTLLMLIVNCADAPAIAGSLTQCKTFGYSIDKDPAGLNVRAGPGTTHRIIGHLKRIDDGDDHYLWPEMDITGSSGNWLRISKATGGLDGDTIFQGTGWVHTSLVATSARGYDAGQVVLRAKRDVTSTAVTTVPQEREIGIRGCSGEWVFGEYKDKRGWLASLDQCPTMATMCN